MSGHSFPLRLPLTTRLQAVELARREGISLNQFIVLAITETVTRMETLAHVQTDDSASIRSGEY